MNEATISNTLDRLRISDSVTNKIHTNDFVDPIWTETQNTEVLSDLPYPYWVSSRSDWVPRKFLDGTNLKVAETCREARDIIHEECENTRNFYKEAQNDIITDLLTTGLAAVQQPKTPMSRSVEFGILRGKMLGTLDNMPKSQVIETPFDVIALTSTNVQSQERRDLERSRHSYDKKMKDIYEEAQKRREMVAQSIQDDIRNRNIIIAKRSQSANGVRNTKKGNRRSLRDGVDGMGRGEEGEREKDILSTSTLNKTNYKIYRDVYNNLITEPFIIPSNRSRILAGRVTANYVRHLRRVSEHISSQSEKREEL